MSSQSSIEILLRMVFKFNLNLVFYHRWKPHSDKARATRNYQCMLRVYLVFACSEAVFHSAVIIFSLLSACCYLSAAWNSLRASVCFEADFNCQWELYERYKTHCSQIFTRILKWIGIDSAIALLVFAFCKHSGSSSCWHGCGGWQHLHKSQGQEHALVPEQSGKRNTTTCLTQPGSAHEQPSDNGREQPLLWC